MAQHTKRNTKTGRFERNKETRMFIQTSKGSVINRDFVNARTWNRILKEEKVPGWNHP